MFNTEIKTEIVKYLIEKKSEINIKDKNGYTALFLATLNKKINLDLIKILVENKAEINGTDKKKNNVLHNLFDFTDCSNTIHIIQYLLSNKAIINQVGPKKNTPLHIAAINPNFQLFLPFFIENNVHFDSLNKYNASPLHYLLKNDLSKNSLSIQSFLLHFNSSSTCSSLPYNPPCSTLLNIQDVDGNTALHYAFKNETLDHLLLEFLLEQKALLSVKNNQSLYPYQLLEKKDDYNLFATILSQPFLTFHSFPSFYNFSSTDSSSISNSLHSVSSNSLHSPLSNSLHSSRHHFFSCFEFRSKVFIFLISLKFCPKNFAIPKPIVFIIFQYYATTFRFSPLSISLPIELN